MKKDTGGKVHVGFELDKKTLAVIDRKAKLELRTRSGLIRKICEEYCAR